MDSYNRGYGEKIEINNLDSVGQQIGKYTIIDESEIEEDEPGRAADFYAIAYEYNDETVISYRGTDNIWVKNHLFG